MCTTMPGYNSELACGTRPVTPDPLSFPDLCNCSRQFTSHLPTPHTLETQVNKFPRYQGRYLGKYQNTKSSHQRGCCYYYFILQVRHRDPRRLNDFHFPQIVQSEEAGLRWTSQLDRCGPCSYSSILELLGSMP